MELVEIFKALNDENRIRIFNLLAQSELCVCEIEAILGITQSNASRHLYKLKGAGIVASDKNAQWVHYRVDEEFIKQNKLLYQYLLSKVEQVQAFEADTIMLKKYKNSRFNCQDLREDKEKVLKFLEEQR